MVAKPVIVHDWRQLSRSRLSSHVFRREQVSIGNGYQNLANHQPPTGSYIYPGEEWAPGGFSGERQQKAAESLKQASLGVHDYESAWNRFPFNQVGEARATE